MENRLILRVIRYGCDLFILCQAENEIKLRQTEAQNQIKIRNAEVGTEASSDTFSISRCMIFLHYTSTRRCKISYFVCDKRFHTSFSLLSLSNCFQNSILCFIFRSQAENSIKISTARAEASNKLIIAEAGG